MRVRTAIVIMMLAGFCCFVSVFASADSLSITSGNILQYSGNTGNFEITGPGLELIQGVSPDGPEFFGECNVGSVCNFDFGVGSLGRFCLYCLGLSSGSVAGHNSADYLEGV